MRQAVPKRASASAAPIALGLALVLGMLIVFREGLRVMVAWWEEPEYTHGWLIPFLSFYLLAIRARALRESVPAASWWGLGVVGLGVLAYVFGELSAIYVIVQYAFVLTLWGLVLTAIGWRGLRVTWAAWLFLLFMVPLPRFIQFNLSAELQLISSELGAWMLRAMGITIYLEGNVIDLGTYQLQVVEACSGLRYLFPLMSLGFICGFLFRGPLWQRWLIFLSSVPITIVMNSFRIAVTGVLVNAWGTEAADGFLHYFEGWVIFTACLALLFLEMWLLAALRGRRLDDALDIEIPRLADLRVLLPAGPVRGPLLAALAVLSGGVFTSFSLADRAERIPDHAPLATFPLQLGGWVGVDQALSAEELAELRTTDYLVANYARPEGPAPVELYVAYYASQRKGASVHSPRACLPSGGWRVESLGEHAIPDVRPDGAPLRVNRSVISLGDERMLVYYWFMQRGRYLTNEYLVKWYIFWDSITQQRTDGALVRLVMPVPDPAALPAADEALAGLVRSALPRLVYHLPGADAAYDSMGEAAIIGARPAAGHAPGGDH